MKWDLPASTRFGEIGIVSAREYHKNGSVTISDLFEYDDSAPFILSSITDGYSTISTKIDASDGYKVSGDVYAVSMKQSDTNYLGFAGASGYQYIYYDGILNDFKYAFNFYGKADSLNDQIQFIIQARASYYDDTGTLVDAYSDYTGGNIPNLYRINNNIAPVQYSGTFERNLSDYGERRWFISYDFHVDGVDKGDNNSINPVPEPGTALLFGVGLLGLAGLRRRMRV